MATTSRALCIFVVFLCIFTSCLVAVFVYERDELMRIRTIRTEWDSNLDFRSKFGEELFCAHDNVNSNGSRPVRKRGKRGGILQRLRKCNIRPP